MKSDKLPEAGTHDQVCYSLAEVDRLQAELDTLKDKLRLQTYASVGEPRAQMVRAIIRARRRREMMFTVDLFGDPAWDILLSLYEAELTQRRASVSDTCIASGVPPTTALRWIDRLYRDGWITRHDDPLDRRRVLVELSTQAIERMTRYFSELDRLPGI